MFYRAQARFALSNSREVIGQVCAHLREHDAEIEDISDGKIVRFQGSSAHISCREIETNIAVSAPTLEGLYFMRLAIASHIREFTTDDELDISWNGDGLEITRPPNFRVLDVVAVKDVTPHMRRLTLTGDVGRYTPLAALHVNLILPHPEVTGPQWPQIGADGLILWPNPEKRPFRRKYTVRAVDAAAGTIDIDFVLHADAGPGSHFALHAKPGDQVGMIGPGGGGLIEAEWYLFAGDETALPAIARMLEYLPAEARGTAIIEVAGEAEIQPIRTASSISVEWLCRNAPAGRKSKSLAAAVESVSFPQDGSKVFAWVGCEYDDFRAIRVYLRQKRKLTKDEHLVVSYWRRGVEESE